MHRRRQLTIVVVGLSLVLAGCSGGGGPTTEPTATPEPTATTVQSEATDDASTASTTTDSERETVQVSGGDLPVDQTEVFWQVQQLLGTDVEPQPVEVRNLTERQGYQPGSAPLFRYLGVGNLSVDAGEPGGLTTQTGKVYVHPGDGTPSEVERVMAHEFVHLVQYRSNMLPWLSEIDQPRLTHDLLQTRLALIEGGAVYATDAYADDHLDDVDPADRMADRYENGTPSAKYFYARYHLGHEYVEGRIDSPEDLPDVYEERPNTTEQVIHGYAPDEEPPAPLAVSANATGEWSQTQNNTMGELFTRVVLQTELDADPARSAATGWGNDVLYGFTTGGEAPGFAWTVRMDSASEADEFASAAEEFADRRGERSDGEFRVVRAGDETAVLLFGNPAFVESASLSGSNANVTVSVE